MLIRILQILSLAIGIVLKIHSLMRRHRQEERYA